jgi:hypothetical protein
MEKKINICVDEIENNILKMEVFGEDIVQIIDMTLDSFRSIFHFNPKEGLYLELSIRDITEERKQRGKETMKKILERDVQKGKLS